MIHHVVYFQLKPDVGTDTLEDLVRQTRSILLKIPEVLSVRSGRNLDPASPWQFYFAIEVDSLEKLRVTLEDPYHLKLMEKWLKPNAIDSLAMNYELDPSKDLKYS